MDEKDTKEIVVAAGGVTEMCKVDPLEAMEKAEAFFGKKLALAIKATTPADWVSQGEKPYLMRTGAMKIAARFGICISDLEIERENLEDEKGRYYAYTVTGVASWPYTGQTIQEMGACSSRDAFFGKNKAVQDVDIVNIKKAAVTNFYSRAILNILGLGGLTWDDLAKYGIKKGGSSTVTYRNTQEAAATTKKAENTMSSAKLPYSSWAHGDKQYVGAYVGSHFTEEFLYNLGMKKSEKKAGLYTCLFNDDVWNALEEEYMAAEDALKATKGE